LADTSKAIYEVNQSKENFMFKKYFTLILTVLVFNLFLSTSAFANTKEDKFAAKVKNEIAKLGTGTDARIEVKLRDKTKLKGYISQVNENSFIIVEDATKTPTEVSYQNTKQAKGSNLPLGVKIAIGVAVVFLALLLLGLAAATVD
jgi:small nuclear ribonucleoprotein (snRNP)-like protein